MKVLLVCDQKIPALLYGGTERIVWWLGKELVNQGHQVTFLTGKGSYCDFADVLIYNPDQDLESQIPDNIDIVHAHFPLNKPISKKPYITTLHSNSSALEERDVNTVFISKNHAKRHGSNVFVYNGLDFNEYGPVDWNIKREHLLFLGKASRSKKNIKGCIKIARALNEDLAVIGGRGLPFRKHIKYKGFIGGEKKNKVINQSKALLFPVIWHEPFGLAIVESLYFGAPAFGSEYGSLPELIIPEVGFVSNSYKELISAAKNYNEYDRKKCNQYVCDIFSVKNMTDRYIDIYHRVLNGEQLHKSRPYNLTKIEQRHYPMQD